MQCLSVYFCAVVSTFLIKGFFNYHGREFPSPYVNFQLGADPVSYTHLDVYKRQVVGWLLLLYLCYGESLPGENKYGDPPWS